MVPKEEQQAVNFLSLPYSDRGVALYVCVCVCVCVYFLFIYLTVCGAGG